VVYPHSTGQNQKSTEKIPVGLPGEGKGGVENCPIRHSNWARDNAASCDFFLFQTCIGESATKRLLLAVLMEKIQ